MMIAFGVIAIAFLLGAIGMIFAIEHATRLNEREPWRD